MRALLILLLLLSGAFAAETDESYAKAMRMAEQKVVAPAFVLKMAEAYAAKPPKAGTSEAEKRDFAREFLTGFAQPNISIGANEASLQGFEAGKAYRRAHPEKMKEVIEGFGYAATEADGVWTHGFEQSTFFSRKSPKEPWWIP